MEMVVSTMRLQSTLLTLAVCLLDMAIGVYQLPPSFKRCARGDPKYDECMGKAVEDAVHQMRNGAPSLGVFPLDPLVIPHLEIRQGQGPVKIDLIFDDMKISGISDSTVTYSKTDSDKHEIRMNAYTEKLQIDADYKINGQVLLLPITGKGKCNVTLTPLNSYFFTKGEIFDNGGKQYMKQTIFDYKLEPKRMYINLDNLFNGDKVLGDNLNKFINDNWQEVFKEIKPALEEGLSLVFLDIANHIYSRVPYDDIYPNEL